MQDNVGVQNEGFLHCIEGDEVSGSGPKRGRRKAMDVISPFKEQLSSVPIQDGSGFCQDCVSARQLSLPLPLLKAALLCPLV